MRLRLVWMLLGMYLVVVLVLCRLVGLGVEWMI